MSTAPEICRLTDEIISETTSPRPLAFGLCEMSVLVFSGRARTGGFRGDMSHHHVPSAASVSLLVCPAKTVLICLAWFADRDLLSSPTLAAISNWCSLTEQGVLNQLSQLERLNLIRIKRGVGRGRNQYRLVLNPVEYNGTVVLNALEHYGAAQLTTKTTSNYTVYKGTDMARFKRPDLVELKFHAVKIGLPESEAEKFFNYYESNGWRVGKSPMKQWKSALANWKINWEQWRTKATNYVNPRNPTGSPL